VIVNHDIHMKIASEGDAYFGRNDACDTSRDDVFEALNSIHDGVNLRDLLEIGCMDGRRLARAADVFGCQATGIEASEKAVQAGRERYPHISVSQGVAPEALESIVGDKEFDVVIVGFFLYLLPRPLLFRTIASVDALLRDGGFLIVSDFLSIMPVRRDYAHNSQLATYKSDYAQAWTWNPQYVLISRSSRSHDSGAASFVDDERNWVTVDVLYKRPVELSYDYR
jgi:SAM-dependent methyltransferase